VLSDVNIGGLVELLRPEKRLSAELSVWRVGRAGCAEDAVEIDGEVVRSVAVRTKGRIGRRIIIDYLRGTL
jgi:hypothetical protein